MPAIRQHILFALILLATGELSPASAQQTTINNATLTVPPGAIPGGDDLFVGTTGTGVLNIVTGGVVTTFEATLGQFATGVGTVNVTGPAATLTTLSNFYIGALGTGALNITGGGVVTSSQGADLGDQVGGTGTVSISGTGSVWNGGDTTVGGFGAGTLTISNGGVFNGDSVILGSSTGSVGTVNVSGPASQFNMTGTLSIGDDGDGTFNVQTAPRSTSTTSTSANPKVRGYSTSRAAAPSSVTMSSSAISAISARVRPMSPAPERHGPSVGA